MVLLLPQSPPGEGGVGLVKNQMNKGSINSVRRAHGGGLESSGVTATRSRSLSETPRLQEQQILKTTDDMQGLLSYVQGRTTADVSTAWRLHPESVQENSTQLL